MQIYVASTFNNKSAVKAINDILTQNGYKVLDQWLSHKNILPLTENIKTAQEYAFEDLANVKKSDVFILLTHSSFGAGSSTELGMAIASYLQNKKPLVYVLGEFLNQNLFYYHPCIQRKQTVEEILDDLHTKFK